MPPLPISHLSHNRTICFTLCLNTLVNTAHSEDERIGVINLTSIVPLDIFLVNKLYKNIVAYFVFESNNVLHGREDYPQNPHLTQDDQMEYNIGERTTGDGVPSAHRSNCVRGGLAVTSFFTVVAHKINKRCQGDQCRGELKELTMCDHRTTPFPFEIEGNKKECEPSSKNSPQQWDPRRGETADRLVILSCHIIAHFDEECKMSWDRRERTK